MRVKATKKGFDGTCLRQVGDVFDIPEFHKNKLGEPIKDDKGVVIPVFDSGWMEEVDARDNPVTPAAKTPPTAGQPANGPSLVEGTVGVVEPEPVHHNKGGRPRKHQ